MEQNSPLELQHSSTTFDNSSLTMYLSSLDIQFLDNRTGQLIANGAFKNSLLHTYPDLGDTTRQVIDSMYNAK
jgi:hypothetical protein